MTPVLIQNTAASPADRCQLFETGIVLYDNSKTLDCIILDERSHLLIWRFWPLIKAEYLFSLGHAPTFCCVLFKPLITRWPVLGALAMRLTLADCFFALSDIGL
jgi:hypothetical protein